MRYAILTLAACGLGLLLAGCGGGPGAHAGATGGTPGRSIPAVVTILWPQPSRYIHLEATTVRITISDNTAFLPRATGASFTADTADNSEMHADIPRSSDGRSVINFNIEPAKPLTIGVRSYYNQTQLASNLPLDTYSHTYSTADIASAISGGQFNITLQLQSNVDHLNVTGTVLRADGKTTIADAVTSAPVPGQTAPHFSGPILQVNDTLSLAAALQDASGKELRPASDTSYITYTSDDPAGRFVQLDAASGVLKRLNSASPSSGKVTVTVAYQQQYKDADTGQSVSDAHTATVDVPLPAGGVNVTPVSPDINVNGTVTLSAAVQSGSGDAADQRVTWAVTDVSGKPVGPSNGILAATTPGSGAGEAKVYSTATYQAPAARGADAKYYVTATSVADPTKVTIVTINVHSTDVGVIIK